MQIAQHTFIVSGGASGLGEASVRGLHSLGANVIVADLNVARGEALAAELGERAAFARTDVTSPDDVAHAVEMAVGRFGALHGAVACAGVAGAEKTVGRTGAPHGVELFAKIIGINLMGTFNVARLAAAQMAKNEPDPATGERGVVVMTASIAAFDGQIGQIGYAASKGAVASMTLPMARDLAPLGIRAMTIAPGLFLTPMMQGLPENVQAALGAGVPFPARLGQPAEYAKLVAAIVENPMLNGETIRLDGALRMAPK